MIFCGNMGFEGKKEEKNTAIDDNNNKNSNGK